MARRFASVLSIALAAFSVGCADEDAQPLPYGGEVLVSHVQFPDGSGIRRLSAHFIAAQEPDALPADVPLGECGLDQTTLQGDSRQYIDVGESVTFHLGDGDFVVPRLDGVEDYYHRFHEVAYLSELSGPGEGFLMAEDSITTADPHSFSDQLRVLQPPIMEVDSPSDGTVEFPRGEDVELTWHQTQPVDDLTVNIVLIGDEAADAVRCRAADTGSFTVPAEVIAGLGASGVVIVYSVSRATVVTEDGRAIDVRAEHHGNLIAWSKAPEPQP